MKKIITILLAGIMILSSISVMGVSAETMESGTVEATEASAETTVPTENVEPTQPATEESSVYKNFVYKIKKGNAVIINYKGSEKSVTIPSKIEGKNVTEIAKFSPDGKGNKTIEKVTIPDTVTKLGQEAFENCTKLKKVTFGKNVSTIGDYCFYCCKSLTKIIIPTKVKSIREGVFQLTGITSIHLGKNITSINLSGLEIKTLKKITVDKKMFFIQANQVFSIMIPKQRLFSVLNLLLFPS